MSRFVCYSQSFRACREALLRVRSAVPGLGSGRDDGTHQLRFPGGSAAERNEDEPGVSGGSAGRHPRAAEGGQFMAELLSGDIHQILL